MIGIIDYGLGNVGSIANLLLKIGAEYQILTQPEELPKADKLILSGVGDFAEGMRLLKARGLITALNARAQEAGTPILGICLGMQLMGLHSEEGDCAGLGWLPAQTVRLQPQPGLRIPHMGWNYVRLSRPHALSTGFDEDSRFYFVHSYHVICEQASDVLMTCHHGEEFVCAFQHNNLYGVQFHPEKSHKFGMRLLQNFHEL